MATFKNLDDLIKKISDDVSEGLKNDVGDKVTKVMQEHIQEDVYDQYDPQMYDRKGEKENEIGLIDEESIDRKMISDDTLRVKNIRKNSMDEQARGEEYSADRNIAEIVETGDGYNWAGVDSKGRTNAVPRPFTQNTREDLRRNGQHTDALKNSLKNKGYDIK